MTARRVSLEAPRVAEQRIETIVVGQRVWVGENPSSERDHRLGSDVIDPSGWRKMTLRCPKRDGSVAEVEMLRPTAWLAEREVRVGGRVDIEVPECGIEGLAEVLAVDRCPPIAPGPGRVVTATFHHHSARTLNVWVEGSSEPIGVTGNHPLWCEEAGDFVRADTLRPGDHVRTLAGPARVASLAPRGPPEPVYNLEVQLEHVYRVGRDGLLVHNGCAVPLGGKAPDQVTPGVTELSGQYVDDVGQVAPWRARYDQYGRQIERTDFTDLPGKTHPNPHHHTREYGPGYGPKGKESDPLPGPGPNTGEL